LLNTIDNTVSSLTDTINNFISGFTEIVPSILNAITNLAGLIIDSFADFALGTLELVDFGLFSFDFSPLLENVPDFMEYFPFSLPHDLYNVVRVASGQAPIETIGMTSREANLFLADQAHHYELYGITPTFINTDAPRFEMHLPEPLNYTFVFDMNDYPQMIAVVRWSILVIFAIGMIKTTPRIIGF